MIDSAPRDLPRNVLDNLLEGCQVISRDYRYLYVNDAVVQQGRSTQGALLGRLMTEAYPGIDKTDMFSVLTRCMTERRPAQMENRFAFSDGATGWFELRFQPVPEGVAILSLDITERKRAEDALRRSVRAFATLSHCNQALTRAADEPTFVREVCRALVDPGAYRYACIGPHGQALEASAASTAEGNRRDAAPSVWRSLWCMRLVSRAVATGRPALARFREPGSEYAPWRDEVSQAGFCASVALPIDAPSAPNRAMVICADEEVSFDEGELALLREVSQDLGHGVETLRARARQAETQAELEQTQAIVRAVYDHLPHAILVWRADDAGIGFSLIDANRAARALTGLDGSAPEVALRALKRVVPQLAEDLTACLAARQAIDREDDCAIPGFSRPRRLLLRYGFVPPDMVLMHGEDVTERRQTEAQLVAVQRLDAVGRLAGGVAHDFNNMLSVILPRAELVLARPEGSPPIREHIGQIAEAGERAAKLTRQLLAFSRKQVLKPQPINLNEVVSSIESLMRRLLGEDIDVRVRTAADLGTVMADPGQIEQVIMNLAVNARDAMPTGGSLTLCTANVELDEAYLAQHPLAKPGRYACMSVTDSGAGMDAETQRQIFEPFFTTKERGKGTGLGLSMVYGIVKQSGGNIWVYSEPGRGSAFKVYLPRIDAAPLARGSTAFAPIATGSETVLLVEDEPAVRRTAARILRRAGYEVLAAGDAVEALGLCEGHSGPIDLLLTDVVMPIMSGAELVEQLKTRRPGVKVLFTSGYTDDALARHGVLSPTTHFIEKPFSVDSLTRKVRATLDQRE